MRSTLLRRCDSDGGGESILGTCRRTEGVLTPLAAGSPAPGVLLNDEAVP